MTSDECKQWHEAHPSGARDEAYMDGLLANVKKRWLERPSERFGQMIVNTADAPLHNRGVELPLLFHLLDEEWCDE